MIQKARTNARALILGGSLFAGFLLLGLAEPARDACGQPPPPPYTLIDNNSKIVVDPALRATIFSWEVDGIEHLKEVSNWYRIGDIDRERSIHTLAVGPILEIDNYGNSDADTLRVTYTHALFSLTMDYEVFGGALGSGYSRMGEQIAITNTSANDLEIHFFEYFDLDLTETPFDDFTRPLTTATGEHYDATTYVYGGTIDADHYEYTHVPFTTSHLSDGGPSLLNDTPPYGTAVGPGDVSLAIQWDFDDINPVRPAIPPGDTVVINKYWELQMNYNVPEPSGGLLAVLGLFALLPARRGRYSRQ